jgi:hypothetical protein
MQLTADPAPLKRAERLTRVPVPKRPKAAGATSTDPDTSTEPVPFSQDAVENRSGDPPDIPDEFGANLD